MKSLSSLQEVIASQNARFPGAHFRRIATISPPVLVAVGFVIVWELYVRSGQISEIVLPAPSMIALTLVAQWQILAGQSLVTFTEALVGLMLATVCGLGLALLLDSSLFLRRGLSPLLVVSQTIPIIVLAPLLLIWFGFDLTPKILTVAIYCFFPITVASLHGLLSTEPEMMQLLKSMGASRWQVLWVLRLPTALPSFFSGLRVAATYSVVGAIFGEYVGAFDGLGVYMSSAYNAHVIAQVFAAITIISAMSLALFAFVAFLEHLIVPWFSSSRSKGNEPH